MSGSHPDPELNDLLGDPALIQVAQILYERAHPGAEPDPSFRTDLRRRLVAEAWRRKQARSPWARLWSRPNLAWAGAAVGLLLIAGVAFQAITTRPFGVREVLLTSPISNAQSVSLRQPIELNFNQPMDQGSVEKSLSIAPAVAVDMSWKSPTQLDVVPVFPLAPDTRYQITVAPTASTQSGQTLTVSGSVGFVTAAPPPAPSGPVPAPSPEPSPVPIKLGPAGILPPLWAADSTHVYVVGPAGELTVYSADGAASQQLVPDQVSALAVGAAGPVWVRAGLLQVGAARYQVPGALAIGFRSSQVVVVTGSSVSLAGGAQLLHLTARATAAEVSSNGEEVAYTAADGLHLVDLASGRDRLLPAATAFAFSPDSQQLVFATGSGVFTTPTTPVAVAPSPEVTPSPTPAGSSSAATPPPSTPNPSPPVAAFQGTRISALGGVVSLSWDPSGRVLADSADGVFLLDSGRTSTPTQVLAPGAGPAVWSPAGEQVAYLQGSDAYVIAVSPVSAVPTQAERDALVSSFLDARQAGNAAQAKAYLDPAGVASYTAITLIYSGHPALVRHSIMLDQSGSVVARLILERGGQDSAVLETMTFARDLAGHLLIDSASASAPRPLGVGPEVLSVQVSPTAVLVQFDSTLNSATLAPGVTLAGVQTTASYDVNRGVVTLTPASPLAPGIAYTLVVDAQLSDIAGHPAAPLRLPLQGPTPTG